MHQTGTEADEYLIERLRGDLASRRLSRAVCFVGGGLLLGMAGTRSGKFIEHLGQHDFPYFREGVLAGAGVILWVTLFGGLAAAYLNRSASRDAANPRRIRELLVRYYDRLCALNAVPDSVPEPARRKWFGFVPAGQTGETDAQLVERLRQELAPKPRMDWSKFILGLGFLTVCGGAIPAAYLLVERLTPKQITGGFLLGFAASIFLLLVGSIAGSALAVSVFGLDTRVKKLVVRYHDRLRESNALPK